MNSKNVCSKDIEKIIVTDNRGYFRLINYFQSNMINTGKKVRLYKVLIRPNYYLRIRMLGAE